MAMHPSESTINEFVDGDLGAADRADVQRHLDQCAECAGLAAELRSLARGAAALGPLAPPAQAWSRIEATLRAGRPSGARSARRWAPLAAAAAIVLAAVVGLRLRVQDSALLEPAGSQAVEAEMREVQQHYDEAFKGLEHIARTERAVLGDAAGATIEQSLAVIDKAIFESRAAVSEEPTSEPAQQSLIESFKMKLSLLQDTVALINELRKTDSETISGS